MKEIFGKLALNKNLIYLPEICPVCKIGSLELKEYKKDNILNLFYI